MALTLHIPPQNPDSGLRGDKVKPVTEGQKVMATQETKESGGFWSGLDDLGGNILSGLGNIAGAVADREADEIRTGAESIVDSTGDPSDQPGGYTVVEKTFIQKYRTELMVVGGAITAAVLFYAIKGK